MRSLTGLIMMAVFCMVSAGCGTAKINKLTAENAVLREQTETLKAENDRLAMELKSAQEEVAKVEAIKSGYEEARGKLQESLKPVAPLLGLTGFELPPFEDLEDSSWVGELPTEMPAGLKGLEALKDLKGLEGLSDLKGLLDLLPPANEPKPQE